MLDPKNSIPRVAAASLVLGGSIGCGGGGSATPESLAENYCKALQECDPDEFDYSYDSLAECSRDTEEELEYYLEYYAEEYGQSCADAVLDYYACFVKAYARTCDDDDSADRCLDEQIRVDNVCD